MPEGDSILWAANRIRPVLLGRVPEQLRTPSPRLLGERWPERLAGQAVARVDTHGKHLFIGFEGGLVLHSHLRMTGAWWVGRAGDRWPRAPRRAWLALRGAEDAEVVQFDGPVLELLTAGRVRFDQRLAGLGPDVLAGAFERDRFLARLRQDEPGRAFGDAVLDQRNLAGVGNIWKSEGCWGAQIDPWRPLRAVTDEEALAFVAFVRPRMLRSATEGPGKVDFRVYRRRGGPCPRCGGRIAARPQGDDNRLTYWCPGCQR